MHSINKDLYRLSISFDPYSLFWEEWSLYKFNGLNEIDLYIINVLKAKDFIFNLDDIGMFYFQKEVIEKLIKKLVVNLRQFKQWILSRFYPALIKFFIENFLDDQKLKNGTENVEYIYLVDSLFTSELGAFSLCPKIKDLIKEFDSKTLEDLILFIEKNFFNQKETFKNVQRLLFAINNPNNLVCKISNTI